MAENPVPVEEQMSNTDIPTDADETAPTWAWDSEVDNACGSLEVLQDYLYLLGDNDQPIPASTAYKVARLIGQIRERLQAMTADEPYWRIPGESA